MAIVQLKPGADIDVLTQGELESSLEAFRSGFAQPPRRIRDLWSTTLDSSGNSFVPGYTPSSFVIWTVTAGFSFSLHRLSIGAQASGGGTIYTFGAPYTSSSGYLELRRSGQFVDSLAFSAGLPAILMYGSDAPFFNNGDRIELFVSGGPASGVLSGTFEGELIAESSVLAAT